MRKSETADFLIIGGGIVGISLALEARRRYPTASVTVIEKEEACGVHASGRNSGVLHAGFYYPADSLKARLTREGNQRLVDYCRERRLRVSRCGKLVVARGPLDLAGLEELLARGRSNGVRLEMVTASEARRIEPRARTHERALYSPDSAAVDAGEVMASLAAEARVSGVKVLTGVSYLDRKGRSVLTTGPTVSAGYVINAAGLYADRIARDFGFARGLRIVPFRGLYLKSTFSEADRPRLHIYPVPDLRYPFLGVHLTCTVDGRVKIGPTASPALWRQHYRGLANFDAGELLEVGILHTRLLARDDFSFRRLALRELAKHSKRRLLKLASSLVNGELHRRHYRWSRPGVRAQLMDVRERQLVMDFRVEGDVSSFHVLNAVSPGFTCALPFAEFAFDRIDHLLNGDRAEVKGVSEAPQGRQPDTASIQGA